MAGVFEDYADFYDILYKDKDYAGDVTFVHNLIQRHRPGLGSVLEFGCGTGGHTLGLSQKGYRVHGIDMSGRMLRQAQRRFAEADPAVADRITCSEGDIRQFRAGQRYDVVVALFHVVSYLTSDEDISACFRAVADHLAPGGVFVFDAWYGPAVAHDLPSVRTKCVESGGTRVVRVATPALDAGRHVVNVRYHVRVESANGRKTGELEESHSMRYLFIPEVESMLGLAGLKLNECGEWLTGVEPSPSSWGVYFIARPDKG